MPRQYVVLAAAVYPRLRLENLHARLDLHAVFVFLGCSAALWVSWLEKVGPRLVSFIATLCWCGGLLLSSAAIYFHQLWLLAGAGVIGGIGLGLGYISPVSTLLRWFPDKRGMAAGMAIMVLAGERW